jgi:hypothetical protein
MAEVCYNYAILCIQIQNRTKAAELFKQSHVGLRSILGSAHPFTIDALYWRDRADQQSKRELELRVTSEDNENSDAAGESVAAEADTVHKYNAEESQTKVDTPSLKSRDIWQPNTKCEHCQAEYNVVVREHHCRTCLKSVCANCSPYRATIIDAGVKKRSRICLEYDRQGFR